MPVLLDLVQHTIEGCKDVTAALAELVPLDQFWRYKDMWSYSLRTAIFAVALVGYLRDRSLTTHAQTCEILGSEYGSHIHSPLTYKIQSRTNVLYYLQKITCTD